jgi:translocation and assembly module TamB
VVAGKATVVDGRVEALPFQRLTATGSYQDRLVTLDVALDAGQLGQLTAVGSLPFARNAPAGVALAPYDLTISSTSLDVGFFQPLTSYVENLRGTGLLNVRLTGPASAPSFDGTVSLAAVTFTVPATGLTYSDLNADLVLAGQQLTVNRFRLVDDDGHAATIEGSLNVPGIAKVSSFEMLISTDDFHLLDNEFGEVAVTSNLQALGDLSTPLVSGTITVNRGRIEVSDLLDRFASGGYRTTPVALPGTSTTTTAAGASVTTPGPEPAPATATAAATRPAASGAAAQPQASSYTRSSLSITLDMPGNVVVRGRDLRTGSGPIGFGDINVTIGGALSIAKESGEDPVLLGRVDVVRGQYQFQGRQFSIVRGSELRFQGSPTNPALDVTAERVISGVTAEVHVAGTLSRPEINLSSNPPLEEGDILSLIVFNQPMNALPGTERVSLAARAGAMAAGAIATPLADSVARALDLDLFEIRPSELAGGGASVRIGRQVSDRLFLGFSQDFGREEVSQLSFEYRLNELISIVTSIAHGSGADYSRRRAQQAGIDLIFMVR